MCTERADYSRVMAILQNGHIAGRLQSHYNSIIMSAGLCRIWCGMHTLGDSGVHALGDTSAFVNSVGRLLLTRRRPGMDGVGIVF